MELSKKGEDQAAGWQAPTTTISVDGGSWRFADDGVQSTFDKNEYCDDTDDGNGVAYTSNEDEPHSRANPPATETEGVTTAEGIGEYDVDWNNIESSENPERTAVKLLHARWWTMRWSNNAISHLSLSRACGLDVEGTCKLSRELRKTMLHHAREMWYTAMDRRHAKDNASAHN